MKATKLLLALAVSLPTLAASLPAEALTAHQYKAQGHGRYLYSNGTRVRYYHGRSWRPHWRTWHRHHWRRS